MKGGRSERSVAEMCQLCHYAASGFLHPPGFCGSSESSNQSVFAAEGVSRSVRRTWLAAWQTLVNFILDRSVAMYQLQISVLSL